MSTTNCLPRAPSTLPTEGDAVVIFDDTGFLKQGRCSVGVARQYTGTIGVVGTSTGITVSTGAPLPGQPPPQCYVLP